MQWYPYDPIRCMGTTFLQLLVGHTIPYSKFCSLLRQYNHLLLFFFIFYFNTLLLQGSCLNILLQVKTQLKYVIVNKNIVKYAYKCLRVRYCRYSNIVNWVYCFGGATILLIFGTTNKFLLHPLPFQIALFRAPPTHFYHYITGPKPCDKLKIAHLKKYWTKQSTLPQNCMSY